MYVWIGCHYRSGYHVAFILLMLGLIPPSVSLAQRVVQPDRHGAGDSLHIWRDQGFWFARLDASGDIQPGPRIYLHRVVIDGLEGVSAKEVRAIWRLEEGRVLRLTRLRQGMKAMLHVLERKGYLLAEVRVAGTYLSRDSSRLTVLLRVKPGPRVPLARVEAPGARRTSPKLLYRMLSMQPGRWITSYDPEYIRGALLSSGLFLEVGRPRLQVYERTGAVIQIPVTERPPGQFDMVFGLQPGGFVGQGYLELRNVLGGGRFLRMQLQRQPGLVSRMHIRVEDPFLLGLPVGVGLAFEGYQRDSTFSTQDLTLKGGWWNSSRWRVYLSLRLRNAQVSGRDSLSSSRSQGAGLEVRYADIDNPENPSRGVQGFVHVESRRKRLRGETVRQQTVEGRFRGFLPLGTRRVGVVGTDIRYMYADRYGIEDYFPLGGASSLRGYAEDQFWGSFVFRGLVEYRYVLGSRSFAYLFTDVGAVQSSSMRWLLGYGIGIRYETPIGVTTVTYALNPQDGFAGGNIHVRLAVGL